MVVAAMAGGGKEAVAREAEATAEVLARRGGNDGRVRSDGG